MKKPIIGIFDSGFGGISVLNYCIDLMPNVNYIYFADSANSPFGTKTKSQLFDIGKNIIDNLLPYDPLEIIVACGTMSTNKIIDLKKEYPNVHLVGTYPTFERILKNGFVASEDEISLINKKISIKRKRKKILIIATDATCKSEYIENLRNGYDSLLDIYVEPCGEIVRAVEKNEVDTFAFRNYIRNLFKEYMDIDYLVLGCTHFPFAEAVIRETLGDKVVIIDGCENAALDAKTYLEENYNKLASVENPFIKIIDTALTEDRKNTYLSLLNPSCLNYNVEFSGVTYSPTP